MSKRRLSARTSRCVDIPHAIVRDSYPYPTFARFLHVNERVFSSDPTGWILWNARC